jgi:Leucine-rich repeat (LRR) protein
MSELFVFERKKNISPMTLLQSTREWFNLIPTYDLKSRMEHNQLKDQNHNELVLDTMIRRGPLDPLNPLNSNRATSPSTRRNESNVVKLILIEIGRKGLLPVRESLDLLVPIQIKYLNICGMKLEIFPSIIIDYLSESLQILKLGCNQFTSLPPTFTTLKKLKSLSITNMHIDKASIRYIFELDILTTLELIDCNLHDNDIYGISNSKLQNNLQILNLCNNQLTYVSVDEIALLSSLTQLDLSYNNIIKLPVSIGYQLSKLIAFDIKKNPITSFPVSIINIIWALKKIKLPVEKTPKYNDIVTISRKYDNNDKNESYYDNHLIQLQRVQRWLNRWQPLLMLPVMIMKEYKCNDSSDNCNDDGNNDNKILRPMHQALCNIDILKLIHSFLYVDMKYCGGDGCGVYGRYRELKRYDNLVELYRRGFVLR